MRGMSVVARILDLLFPPRESERLVRAASQDLFAAHLVPREIPLGNGTALGLFPYRVPLVQALVVEAKFHGNQAAQRLLGEALAEYLMELYADEAALAGTLALVPLPLSEERRRERGYNQDERICQIAAERLPGMKVCADTLYRTRHTAPQTSLLRDARLKNMEGAFSARSVDKEVTYVLMDDVITTGATMEAGINALEAAGARRVIPIALAY